MTAVTAGPSGPDLFRMLPSGSNNLFRKNSETFLLSLLGQAAVVGLLIYLTSCIIKNPPTAIHGPISFDHIPVIFSGNGGGGGGGRDTLPASQGHLPKLSLADQVVPPIVMRPVQTPKLAVDESVMVAPEVKLPQGSQIGDPLSKFAVMSDGPGGPGGIGWGCCDGIGPSKGPHYGVGQEGIYPAGKMGVTVPQAIFSPEPAFSDEARKFKTQGVVVLMLIVGKDGHTYDIRVRQSLGMGLDEKAIEAVNRWRFRPATLNGIAVATQIAVEVDFHLY